MEWSFSQLYNCRHAGHGTVSSADPVQIAMRKGLVAGTVNLILARMQGATLPGPGMILAAGVVGFLGYGVSVAMNR